VFQNLRFAFLSGDNETDSNVSLVLPETLFEKSEVSVDFSEQNALIAKT
jgi:hypothetical protein